MLRPSAKAMARWVAKQFVASQCRLIHEWRAAHFARQIEPLCYRTSKYRRGRSLLALCIALNTKKSTRHITSIATSDILVVVIVVTGLNRVPDKDWSFRISRRHRQFLARASRSCAAGRHYQFA